MVAQLRRRKRIIEYDSQRLGHPPAPHSHTMVQPCLQPPSLPQSPHSQRLSVGSSTASGCSLPSPAGNVLLEEFSAGWSGGLAVFSMEVPCGWAVLDQALLGFRGSRFLQHRGGKVGLVLDPWLWQWAGMSLSQALCLERC